MFPTGHICPTGGSGEIARDNDSLVNRSGISNPRNLNSPPRSWASCSNLAIDKARNRTTINFHNTVRVMKTPDPLPAFTNRVGPRGDAAREPTFDQF
jgi:hypothetical protein